MYNNNESTIKLINDSLIRDSFETYEQFKTRIEKLKSICIGKAEILANTYDRKSGICYIDVEFYKWDSITKIDYSYLYFILPNKDIDFIKNLNDRFTIRASLKVKGEKVYVDTESIEICINDMELKIHTISIFKLPFETNNDFMNKVVNIRDIPIGRVTIERHNYDINTGVFIINVEFNTFKEVKIPNVNVFYVIIKREEAEEFYNDNNSCTLYGGLNYINGEIFIDIQKNYLLWGENKISVHAVLLDNMYFDTAEEYTNQMKNLSLLCAGKASLIVDKYNKDEETLPIYIEWENWIKEYVLDIGETYIESDLRFSKDLYESGDEYLVYVTLKYENNSINIEKIKIINFKGDIEVKFENVHSTIVNTAFEENSSVVDVVVYDDNNDDDDDYAINEKFDFVNGIALMKVNGNYTYIDSHGKRLGLINNRLMRFISSKGKYGYMDKEDRITIIKPYFDYIGAFNDNVARININDKWGYINEEGQIIIKPIYELARDFHDGFAAVKVKSIIGKKWGYINKLGQMVIKPRFDEVGEFCDGVANVKVRSVLMGIKEGFVYKNGEFHDYVKI